MNYTLEVKQEADEDLQEAASYYEEQQQGLAEKFLVAWETIAQSIERNPLIFQKHYREFRFALMKKFPYLVIFQVSGKTITVFAVIHAKRHPAKRYTRK